MRFALALAVTASLAGAAMADMPPGGWQERPRLLAPGGWCGGLTAGLAVVVGGLWLIRWRRRV